MRRRLIVDDDPLIGQAMHAWLKQHGYSVSTAGSGAEGLALLERSTFDLLEPRDWKSKSETQGTRIRQASS